MNAADTYSANICYTAQQCEIIHPLNQLVIQSHLAPNHNKCYLKRPSKTLEDLLVL